MKTYQWPYPNEVGQEEVAECDVLVLGGGLAGCFAAIAAAPHGQSVLLVDKGATARSVSPGTDTDHRESSSTNPSSKA